MTENDRIWAKNGNKCTVENCGTTYPKSKNNCSSFSSIFHIERLVSRYGRLKLKFLCNQISHCIYSFCSIELTKSRNTWSLYISYLISYWCLNDQYLYHTYTAIYFTTLIRTCATYCTTLIHVPFTVPYQYLSTPISVPYIYLYHTYAQCAKGKCWFWMFFWFYWVCLV